MAPFSLHEVHMKTNDLALAEIHECMVRNLCRKASHIEVFYSNQKGKVRIELTADRIKAFVICPEEGWTSWTARPTGKCSDQQFMSYAVQLAQLGGIKHVIYDNKDMTYTFRLGLTRIVLSGPVSALW